jgi:hypothetical protein
MLWRNKHLTTGVFLELDKYFCFATCRILFGLLTQIPAIGNNSTVGDGGDRADRRPAANYCDKNGGGAGAKGRYRQEM